MRYDEAKEILGASCAVQDDKSKVWYVKMPEFVHLEDTSLLAPEIYMLDEDESDLNEYMLDPTDPVVCVPEQDDPEYWTVEHIADLCHTRDHAKPAVCSRISRARGTIA